MAERRKRRDGKKKQSGARLWNPQAKPLYVAGLHRRPRQWDILVFELSKVMGKACHSARARLKHPEFRFLQEQLVTVGWMLARATDVRLALRCGEEARDGRPCSLLSLDELTIEQVVQSGREACDQVL